VTKPRVNIDIIDMLSFLGVKQVEKEGKEVWFQCPFPGHKPGSGNRNASFRESPKHEWWVFNCFVCGNHGTAADFWALHQGVRRAQARLALRQRYGSAFIDPGEGSAVLDEIDRILGAKEETKPRLPVPLPESVVEEMSVDWKGVWDAYQDDALGPELPAALTYMFRRGFMWQTLAEADIGYDTISEMISIPYRDAEGHPVAFKGRAWWPDAKPKYKMLGNKGKEDRYTFDTVDISYLMYGEWDLPPGGKLIVTEGELNRLALKQYGHRRTLGLSGQFLHEHQAQIIARHTDEVVLLFDEEEKAEKAAALLEPRIRSVEIVPEHDGDPADASDEEVASWLDDAYPSTMLD
jgi:DNA primase